MSVIAVPVASSVVKPKPESSVALIHGAQACALLAGRDYIVPEDVQHMAVQVLAHRLVLSPEARMKGVTPESVVRRIVQNTPVPVKL